MGRRCWSLDQCFAAVLVGSSYCCTGCLFGHDPPANSLPSSRARDSRVLPVVGLRCRHRGQRKRLSTTGIPEFLFVERWGQIQTRLVFISSVLVGTTVAVGYFWYTARSNWVHRVVLRLLFSSSFLTFIVSVSQHDSKRPSPRFFRRLGFLTVIFFTDTISPSFYQ